MTSLGTLATHEHDGGACIELPPRVLPITLRQFARAAMVLGLVLLAVSVGPLTYGELHAAPWVYVVAALFSLPPLAFGILILYSRSTVDCTNGALCVRERIGPLIYKRTYDVNTITSLQVEVLTFNLSGKADGGFQSSESITIMAADTRHAGRRVLLFGYPAPLLEQVITELRRHSDWVAPRVTGLGKAGVAKPV